MGQQQLLLIVLGVIITGLAVVIGIQMFTVNERISQIETMVTEGTAFGTLAQQYCKKPKSMGGGGGSFDGWFFPSSYPVISTDGKSCSTAVAVYQADYSDPKELIIYSRNCDYRDGNPGKILINFGVSSTNLKTIIDASGGPWG
jgi:hypothetical protein